MSLGAGGADLTVRVLAKIREIDAESLAGLLAPGDSPFVEHTWLDLLESTGCVGRGTGWTPAHLSLWRGHRLVAVSPSYVKDNSEGEFVFDWAWADFSQRVGLAYYPKIVVAVPFTPATGARVLAAPGEDRAGATLAMARVARERCESMGASGVHVLFPSDPEADVWQAAGYLPREGFQYHWFRDGAVTFDDYLARFSSKQRNQIRRELRSVAERGIVVEVLAPDEHTVDMARVMYSFYRATIEKHGPWGRLYLTRGFFEAVVQRFRHRLAWVVAREGRGGPVVGGAFNVTDGKRLYGRYWGTTGDIAQLHFVVCYYAGIRYCIEQGLDAFEPGAGGEHKRARGFVPTVTRSAHWLSDATLRSALEPWLARERARVRALTEP